MRKSGTVIFLKANLATLWSRVKHSSNRPLLEGDLPEETLRTIMKARTPLYEKAAHAVMVTDGKTPGQVADEINESIPK